MLRQESGAVSTLTVPLPEWRTGDFSNLRNSNGQPIVIYDPATTRADPDNPGQFIREPFPGNRIPANRMSPVGRALAQYWPQPNTTPTNAFTQAGNYTASGAPPSEGDRIDSRVDHVINDKWRMFVRYSWSDEAASRSTASRIRRAPPVVTGPRSRPRTASRSTTTTSSARPSSSTCATA